MPIGTYLEPKFLDSMLGCCVAQCNSTISAGTAAQTTFNLRGSIGSGNADLTPAANDVWLFVTPGSGATQNQYTNADVFLATSGTATSITFASRTVVAARAVGDFGFRLATTTTFTNWALENTVYVGLSTVGAQTIINMAKTALPTGTLTVVSTTGFAASGTAIVASSNGLQVVAYTGITGTTLTGCTGGTGSVVGTGTAGDDIVFQYPTQALILSNEPSSTGSYARVASVNNPTNWPAAAAGPGSSKSNGGTITFPASSAAWSSGATLLDLFFLADVTTLASGNVLAWGYLTTPQTVNAAGITPSFAASALTATLL